VAGLEGHATHLPGVRRRDLGQHDLMASNLGDGFAIYPMVEEGEATGAVAGVYAQLLTRMPFVPSLFKSFALCPQYLVLAYEQSAGVLDGNELKTSGQELGASVRDVVQPPEQEQVRQTLAAFVGPLGRMLLLSSGLLLALHGELDAPPAPGAAPAGRPVEPGQPAPSQWDAPAPALYGALRAALDTPLVNTIWRKLAAEGQLEQAWSALEPQVASSRSAADALQDRSLTAARSLPWTVVASRDALVAAGIGDAAPGMAAVLDAYVKTLPRLLVLASSSTAEHPDHQESADQSR